MQNSNCLNAAEAAVVMTALHDLIRKDEMVIRQHLFTNIGFVDGDTIRYYRAAHSAYEKVKGARV